jgi:hypothetical protein
MKKLIITKLLAVAIMLGTLTTDSFAMTRIRFAPGRSSATVSGTLRAGGTTRYVLTAREYQTMTVRLSSRNDDVRFEISDIHGPFDTYYDGFARIETDANGNHWIVLKNTGRRATRYTMTVSIR